MFSTVVVALSLALAQAQPAAAPVTADALQNAYRELKTAEEAKDNPAVKKWAVETAKLAHALQKAPPDADAEAQKARLQMAKEVDEYADYALSAAAARATKPEEILEYRDALAAQSPDSKYMNGANTAYIAALEAANDQKKLFPFAEKAIAKDPNNEALLAVLTDGYYARRAWGPASTYGMKLGQISKSPVLQGRGYYLAGQAFAAQSRFPQADKALRAALPLVKEDANLYPATLFQLGIANYNLSKATHDRVALKDAVAFSEECSKLNSPYTSQAANNAFTMKKELAAFR